MDTLLLDYLDGKLGGSQLVMVKEKIEASEELKSRLDTLRIIHNSLEQQKLENPSANFTQRVMNNLHHAPTTSRLTPKNGILLLCGIMVATGIGVVMVDAGFFNSLNGMLALDKINLPVNLPTDAIPSIPFNGKILVNAIITLNLGLAFLILDRTILRPLFNRRSRVQL